MCGCWFVGNVVWMSKGCTWFVCAYCGCLSIFMAPAKMADPSMFCFFPSGFDLEDWISSWFYSLALKVENVVTDSVNTQDEGIGHLVHHINGLPLPPFVTKPQLDSMKKMELFPDDIWVATYQRSGTTWTQQIVRSILAKGDEDLRIDQAVLLLSDLELPRVTCHTTACHVAHLKIRLESTSMWLATQRILQISSLVQGSVESINWPIFASMFLSGQVWQLFRACSGLVGAQG